MKENEFWSTGKVELPVKRLRLQEQFEVKITNAQFGAC